MSELKSFLVMFVALIISLAFAQYDFSGMQYGSIINFLGALSTLGIPLGYTLAILNKYNLLK